MKNTETGHIDQFDLGHGLVEKINGINRDRVLKRREFKSPNQENVTLRQIKEELQEMKLMMEEIKKAVL